jgi:hypothetical protein
MTDAGQFEKGDCVLYGARAVCRVSDVGPLAFSGDKNAILLHAASPF